MPPSKTEVILTGIDNWDDWQKFVASLIDIDIWEAIKPANRTQVLLRKPRRPQASDFNANAETEVNLSASQVNAFRLARDNWKDSSKEYEQQKTNLIKAKSVIISYVDERLGRYLDQDHDLPRWIESLSVAVNAEQTKATDALVMEYQQIIMSFRCTDSATFADWIWKWENFLLKAARHRMLEVAGGRWLFDIARLMAKHNGNFTDNCRQAAESLVLKTKDYNNAVEQGVQQLLQLNDLSDHAGLREAAVAIQGALIHTPPNATDASKEWSIGSVAVKLRTWASSALPTQPERPSARRGTAFQADTRKSNDGGRASQSQSDRKRGRSDNQQDSNKRQELSCEACGQRRHDFSSCWSAIPELRPEGVPANHRLEGLVRKVLAADPELKAKVAELRKAAQKDQQQQEQEKKQGAAFPICLGTCLQADQYPLRSSTILDSGASLDIFNDLARFKSIRKPESGQEHYLIAGNSEVKIEGYGRVDLPVTRPDGSIGILRIKDAAYCPTFAVNAVSFQCLYDRGIRWDTISTPTQLIHKSGTPICMVERYYKQWILQYRKTTDASLKAAATYVARRKRRTTRDQKADAIADGTLWHNRLGHPSPKTIEQLGKKYLGVKLRGPKTVECDHCGRGKMHRQISRRRPIRPNKPFEEIWVDWTDLTEDYQGFVRVMFITDAYSGLVFPYFLKSHGVGKENRRILRDFFNWIEVQYSFKPKAIRSDGELFSKEVRKELKRRSIEAKKSAPNTQAQNGGAERAGGVIMEKARTMRIAAKLPHNLWKDIVEAACYLRNRTPLERNKWHSPFGSVFKKQPILSHLKAYGCKAFAMTADAQLKLHRKQKLEPRAHIGYLVGYQSSNIYKIWVPHKNRVILTRDVIFNESSFFENKIAQPELRQSISQLLEEIEIPEEQQVMESMLEQETLNNSDESDEEILDEIVVDTGMQDESDGEGDEDACERSGYITPPLTDTELEESPEAIFTANLPIRHRSGHPEGVDTKGHNSNCCDYKVEQVSANYRFHEFHPLQIETAVHGTFNAGIKFRPHKRDLPEAPKTMKDLQGHPFQDEFIKAQQEHLASHGQMNSFVEVPWSRAKGQRVLSCMWVFTYKTDKHGHLQNCKARLVVCGNQQEKNALPTRATTLASMSFRALMAIAAEHDLELEQMDAVNAFVNCELDEVVYMRMPPGYEKCGRVLRLKKALYGLRRSPLLWQKELTKCLQELGFQPVPQEPCIMTKGPVIVFFFVDDIICAYKKAGKNIAKAAIEGLKSRYRMTQLGEPKWFLGIHILRNRRNRTIWLTQDAYIDKVAHKFSIQLDGKVPATPMGLEELLKSEAQATKKSIEVYQQKVGSILFAAISTRPDIAFAVSRLARHNLNPSDAHHRAADRVVQYLYSTRSFALRLGTNNQHRNRPVETFIGSSDASFADNTEDRKSSQGYVLRLYGGPIAWKASKQTTVTTSSTEAELVAASEAAKEMIAAGRLLNSLRIKLDEPLHLEIDNKQTIRLLVEGSAKLTTQLRHVDIYQHWLRQQVQSSRIKVQWVESKDMVADGMTKALPKVRHTEFLRQLRIEDIRSRIGNEAKLEEARSKVRERLQSPGNKLDLELKLGAKGGKKSAIPGGPSCYKR
ncbi:reverse transcriptase, partial [Metarhizium majus ARSEF 297]